jgi:hypothetical protein
MNQVFGVTGVPVGRCKVIRIWNNQVENDIIGSFGLLKLLLRGVPKLELLSCLCEPDRAKQSPTLQEIASAEDHRLATTSSFIISDLGTPGVF